MGGNDFRSVVTGPGIYRVQYDTGKEIVESLINVKYIKGRPPSNSKNDNYNWRCYLEEIPITENAYLIAPVAQDLSISVWMDNDYYIYSVASNVDWIEAKYFNETVTTRGSRIPSF